MPQPSITRLEEILNGLGAAPTLQEVQLYLSPEVKQAFHVSAAVEARLRGIDLRLRSDEARFQESLKSLLTPWRDELLAIDNAARSSIIAHISMMEMPVASAGIQPEACTSSFKTNGPTIGKRWRLQSGSGTN